MKYEFTFRSGRMRPAHAQSSGSEALLRIRSSADCTIDTHEFKFSEATGWKSQIFTLVQKPSGESQLGMEEPVQNKLQKSRPLGVCMSQDVVAADLVVQGVETIAGFCLRFRVQRRLQFLNTHRS